MMIMKFKPGDHVTVTKSLVAIADADRRLFLGRELLPGRGRSAAPIDLSAQGCVQAIDHGCVAVRWDNPRYGEYWYRAEYLMPLCGGGF